MPMYYFVENFVDTIEKEVLNIVFYFISTAILFQYISKAHRN